MRKEYALVLDTYSDGLAEVELKKSAACDGCDRCSDGKSVVVKATNDIKASKGDSVIIEIEPFKRGAIIFVYILPIACLILGYFLGYFISKIFSGLNLENYGVLGAFSLFILYCVFGIIKLKKGNKIAAHIVGKNAQKDGHD